MRQKGCRRSPYTVTTRKRRRPMRFYDDSEHRLYCLSVYCRQRGRRKPSFTIRPFLKRTHRQSRSWNSIEEQRSVTSPEFMQRYRQRLVKHLGKESSIQLICKSVVRSVCYIPKLFRKSMIRPIQGRSVRSTATRSPRDIHSFIDRNALLGKASRQELRGGGGND